MQVCRWLRTARLFHQLLVAGICLGVSMQACVCVCVCACCACVYVCVCVAHVCVCVCVLRMCVCVCCLVYTYPSQRDSTRARMQYSA